MTACGGGGSDTGSSAPITEVQKTVLGGTANAPASVGFDAQNIINNNSFNNYFKYAGATGERLVIRVNLTTPLSDAQTSRCASSSGTGAIRSSYDSQIHVYSTSNIRVDGVCGEDLTYTFPENGVKIFNFEFPSNGSGFFNVASLNGNAAVKFSENGTGSPVEPKIINTASANSLGSNVFGNYYWISAGKGQTIVINTTLNQPLSSTQKARCASGPGYKTQILVYNSQLNQVGLVCGDSLRFDVPENGNYVFQFNYGSQSAGVFNASRI